MAALVISATEFKAKCLAILDDVQKHGNTVTVTKRGRPVATVGPAQAKKFKSLKGCLAGKVHISDEDLKRSREKLKRSLMERVKKLSDEFSA
ncbi:MAG: type II toxin-antitoxin system prevent-host-death family antitoxin [Acidobacteriota bacterium]|nr:type II toxin-antitoxin system prevent-host-death family antitoxin [Acidobacteriota bacterium]